ncbi:collagenase [Nonomuraea sp. NBC_01738]|uniref:collagenase n=1 Tax=Nonomuraea sp. NBC_01738 TaxID=2976003 RepID=UPI002E0DF20B|nr:collagenase [Nonomuraea sp. NBC_01738]
MKVAGSLLLAAGLVLGGLAVPAQADVRQSATAQAQPARKADPAPQPAQQAAHPDQRQALDAEDRPPQSADKNLLKRDYAKPGDQQGKARALAAACDVEGKTGSALVAAVKAADSACVNGLFSLTGTRARAAFQESQMVTVANALRDNGAAYPGDNSTATLQLVMYLRAGYYVQWYYPQDVGTYGASLRTAIRGGLDAFFANSRSSTVSDANGEVLSEAVILIDSSQENARYLYVVKRLLDGYNSSYDSLWYMMSSVNGVFTVLFRGHQVPEFVTAVQNDPSVLDTLSAFATRNLAKLGGDQGYLVSNAGRELARFVQHAPLQAKVRPLLRGLLNQTSITGPTAPLWVGIAEMADYYDQANCSYYGTCDLANRLTAAALPVQHTCSSTLRIRAQQMTSAELGATCSSLAAQDAYFHNLAQDSGPVAGDNNTSLEVIAFDSSTDYQTYAGAIFGIDTNNGGMYLEGDPSAAGNQPRFIAYEAEWLRPTFAIWNLNHEYTHYLDGRFDMAGDFGAGVSTPTIWWIEGFAEYVSYGYRGEVYTAAITEAAKHTYSLSALFDTTYDHDTQRIYRWGYLGVRYMFEKRRGELNTVLGHYRAGNWTAARTYLKSLNHDADFDAWLTACAAGACGGGGTVNQPPSASFTAAANGLTVTLADTSTDSDGSIAARSWEFGDGTTSTSASPTKTYGAAGTYTVKLTVTDDKGATASATKNVTVSSTTLPECTGSDTRALGKNCRRSNASATQGNYAYYFILIPAGTTKLTITSSGGTGDADLYYNGSSWATTGSYTQRATGAGNTHTITVNNPPSGYNYISLYGTAAFSGATVSTTY